MSVIPPLITKQSVFACKVEATTGTAESLTASEGAYNAFDVEVQGEIDYAERQGQGSASYLPGVSGARRGKCRLRTELFGSGSNPSPTPAYADTLLAACGFSGSSNVYKPVTGSASYVSLTMAKYVDGRKKTIAGATGNLVIRGAVGKPIDLLWEFSGVWVDPTATSLIAPTYPTVIPPALLGATITVGGSAYRLPGFEIDMGNTVAYRQDANNAAGYLATVVSNRKPVLKISPEALALGTKDWYADMKSGATAAVSIAVGSTSGNTLTLAAPVAQLTAAPQDEDRDGVLADGLTLLLCRSAAAGDDELTITFS